MKQGEQLSKLFSFGNSNHLAIPLKLLCGNLSVVSKDITDQPEYQLSLQILMNLSSTIVLEGEAGSGKKVLIRKISLWVSCACPILSRFRFVFSLMYATSEQSMTDIIYNHVVGLGLLRKCTVQRLDPFHKFFHPLFQEFIAGRSLSELLVSDENNGGRAAVLPLRKVAGFYTFYWFTLADFLLKQSLKLYPIDLN
ncbi:LOW QUALITY PROTEIN: baculoviral IAP repeat-containing protein 1 [Phaethornis superciliosus]